MREENGGAAPDCALGERMSAAGLPKSLAAFCAAQADRHGDAIATDFFQDTVQLSYTALHQRSNRIAANDDFAYRESESAIFQHINLIFRPRRYQLTAISHRHARNDAFSLWADYAAKMTA